MLKRTLTGSVIFLITALAIMSRSISIYFFDLFVMIVSFVATYELIKVNLVEEQKINLPIKNTSYAYLPLVYCYLCYACYSFAETVTYAIIYQILAFLALFLIAFIVDLIYLKNARKLGIEIEEQYLLRGTKVTAKIMLYPITLLGTLYGFGISGSSIVLGTVLVLTVFLITMATDVFAYLFGMAFHKGVLASQISPKKSISGAIGGIFGGIIAAAGVFLVCYFALETSPFVGYSLTEVITFFSLAGVFGSLFTQMGDLIASAIKRRVGIKDYGKLFPGHGGMMDRVDGLCFTSTLIFILAVIIFFI